MPERQAVQQETRFHTNAQVEAVKQSTGHDEAWPSEREQAHISSNFGGSRFAATAPDEDEVNSFTVSRHYICSGFGTAQRPPHEAAGFGLLGHLVEMTKPSGVDAELNLAAVPVLDGAEETSAAGILSSLQPANLRLRRALRNHQEALRHPRYPLVFDPQTAGGLLASIPEERAEACLKALRALGYQHAAAIGRVLPQGEALEPIVLAWPR